MGLFGLRTSSVIADRIFTIMDKSNSGCVSFTEFLDYMDVLINGSREEKIFQSFQLIAYKDKQLIHYDDFSSWIKGIRKVYNSINDVKIESSDENIRQCFDQVDLNKDGVIDFKEYKRVFTIESPMFDWIDIVKKSSSESSEACIQTPMRKRLDSVEKQLNECLELLDSQSQDLETSLSSHEVSSPNLNLSAISAVSPERGPLFNCLKESKHNGDIDEPSFFSDSENESFNQIDETRNSTENTRNRETLFSESSDYKAKQRSIIDSIKGLAKKINFIKEEADQLPKQISNSPSKNMWIQWGDPDWHLILNMMLGIQKSVRAVEISDEPIMPHIKDYKIKSTFNLNTENIQTENCKFTEYAPKVFKRMRSSSRITENDFIHSLGVEKIMRSLINNDLASFIGAVTSGGSGSLFYFSYDGKYVLKTIPYGEYAFFRNSLSEYFIHFLKNPSSLLPRFYGFYKIHYISNGNHTKKYFLVMKNLFPNTHQINLKFDLKGSTYSRSTNLNDDLSVARKDKDFNHSGLRVRLGPDNKQKFLKILENDCSYFSDMQIMDYSLLIGFHYIRAKTNTNQNSNLDFIENESGTWISTEGDELYFIGLIDVLTQYTPKKRFENLIKGGIYGQSAVSSVHPKLYTTRFLKYISSIID